MKKLIGIFAGLAAAFTIGAAAVSAQSTGINDITMLNRLEVFNGYDDGSLHEEANITRMEYAAVIIRCLGLEDLAKSYSGGESFTDVSGESWGSGYVRLAKELGIINGYDESIFGPNDNITITDAAKILVCALGYGQQAENNGGYPTGYLTTAGQIDMLKGIGGYESKATRADIAKMIVNSLETEFITKDVSTQYPTYGKSDQTILECMDIKKITDKVTAVYGYSIDGSDMLLDKNQLVISGERYYTTLAPENSYAGMESYIYIKAYNEDDATVLLVVPKSKNDTITVQAADIDSETTINTLKYWTGEKQKELRLARDMSLIYNGATVNTTAEFTADKLCPECGYVTLIDADGNGEYETVFVKNYTTYVVQSIKSETIYDVFGNNFTYKDDDEITVYKDGKQIEFGDIKAGDVICTAVSLDGNKMEILVSDKTVSGKVTSSYIENEKTYYSIDSGSEKGYCCTPGYLKALAAGYANAEEFAVGDSVTWYLNAFNEIANVQMNEESLRKMSYGYLTRAVYEDYDSENPLYLTIITVKNEWETLQTVPKKSTLFGRVVNGKYSVARMKQQEILDELGSGDKTTAQLVKYKTDENGYITELYLLDNKKNSKYFSKDKDRSNSPFAYHIINNQYYYDDNTIVLHIPSLGAYPERISAGRPSDYFANNKSYATECYDIDENGYVNLIVYCEPVTSYNRPYIKYANSSVMLITDIHETYNEDDSESYMVVEGYVDGQRVEELVSHKMDYSKVSKDLKKGMVIQYETTTELRSYAQTSDETLAIILYNILFDANEKEQENFSYWNYNTTHVTNAKIKVAYGTVTRLDYPFFRTDSRLNPVYEMSGGADFYKYTSDDGFEKIDANEVCEGDKVFVRTRYNSLREVIVVE